MLALSLCACATWPLGSALVAFGDAPSHALALSLLTVAVFAAGVLYGGGREGRHYRRYAQWGIVDWLLLLVPVVLLLRILPLLLEGAAAVAADVAVWVGTPWRIFDAAVVWGVLWLFAVWEAARRVGQDLLTLSFQPGDRSGGLGSDDQRDPLGSLASPDRTADRDGAFRRLAWKVVGGGMAVIVLTGLTAVSPSELRDLGRPHDNVPPPTSPATLVFHVLGLWLLGQAHLSRLRAGWLAMGATVQSGLHRRWLGYGAAVLAPALALALLFPTPAPDAAADQLPHIQRWLWIGSWPVRAAVGTVADTVAAGVWLIVGGAWSLVSWLVRPATPEPRTDAVPVAARLTPAPTPPPSPLATYAAAAKELPWTAIAYVVLGLAGACAVWYLWRKRRSVAAGLAGSAQWLASFVTDCLLRALLLLSRLLRTDPPRLFRGAQRPQSASANQRSPGGDPRGATSWLRLRALSTRALIHYFYISTLQRAANAGWPRLHSQTPYEYGRQLAVRLPHRKGDVEALTEAFVRARYSPAAVTEADVRKAERPWKLLRASLKGPRLIAAVVRHLALPLRR